MTVLYVVACATLIYTSFCRAVLMSRDTTRLAVRLAFVSLGSSAAFGLLALALWGYSPSLPSVTILVSFAAVQIVTSRLWREGVPARFRSV
ncbi:hypothetical protein [Rubrivivax rivuli]|uniref:Uncharacterized protein n=1 Tax=Rubrivivax rivuli TaxID=1862385 RepID=A0A437REZ5_9BURK|nr:hypothetical protein [Rubrivivax rivuli]RVU45336.1 hypothetical protein EOE66_14510 [Rubrivivax rivuli]